MNIICGVCFSAMVCKASSSHVVQLGGSAFCQCCSTVTMTKPTDLSYFVSGFLAFELMSMQRNRCQGHGSAICSLYLHLTCVVFLLLMDEVLSVMGETYYVWKCDPCAEVPKMHVSDWANVGRMLSHVLVFLAVTMMIFIFRRDDQEVRNGSRSCSR